MPDELTPDIQAKLSDLCREVSGARGLDAGQQEKLQRRAKETLLAYLDGNEPISEDEAFVLVREHFGDPAVVKDLFDRVHTWEARATLGRRLAAVFILMFALATLFHALRSAFWIPSMLWLGSGRDSQFLVSFMRSELAFIVPGFLTPLIVWVCLRRWQRAIERGDRVWFLEWTPRQLVVVLVLVYLAKGFGVDVRPSMERLHSLFLFLQGTVQFPWAYTVMAFLVCLIECGVIFWWCDRPPRRWQAIAYTLAAWLLSVLTPTFLIDVPVHVLLYTDVIQPAHAATFLASLGQLHIFGAIWHVGISVRPLAGLAWILNGPLGAVEIAHRFLNVLLVQGYLLLPGLLVALGYLVVRYRKGEISIRSPFGTRMSDLMDMMPMEEDEHRGDGPDGD